MGADQSEPVRPDDYAAQPPGKWRVLGVVLLGTLIGSIDSTVLVIAFPQLAQDLHASLVDTVWVIIVYNLVGTALILSFARVADMSGRKRLFLAGFAVFAAGSAVCGLSGSAVELIASRAVQGIGGALLLANSFAILSDTFAPSERGRVFGINSVVWASGTFLGLALGGAILTVTTWRWIFWINLPIAGVAMVLVSVVLTESVTPNSKETFDLGAAALFTGGLALLLLGLSDEILGGWYSAWTFGPLLVGAALLCLFVAWEARISRDPILPLPFFRSRLFSASIVALILQGVGLFATNLLLMVYLQGFRGVAVLSAAYLLLPMSAALAAIGPVGGWLSDRYGARLISTTGLIVQGTALVLLSTVTASTPLMTFAAYEAVLGAGGGLFYPANAAAIMGSASRDRHGVASGILMTVRNTSIAASLAIGLAVLTSHLPALVGPEIVGGAFSSGGALSGGPGTTGQGAAFLSGMIQTFRLFGVLMWIGAVFSALRGRENRSVVPRERPIPSSRMLAEPADFDRGPPNDEFTSERPT